jgi:2-keto-3-deoxy-6-phosphogluconate aldolase
MIITMQEFSMKITAGEGNFKFFPVEISGGFIFTIS